MKYLIMQIHKYQKRDSIFLRFIMFFKNKKKISFKNGDYPKSQNYINNNRIKY